MEMWAARESGLERVEEKSGGLERVEEKSGREKKLNK